MRSYVLFFCENYCKSATCTHLDIKLVGSSHRLLGQFIILGNAVYVQAVFIYLGNIFAIGQEG